MGARPGFVILSVENTFFLQERSSWQFGLVEASRMDVFRIAELGKELGYTGEALRTFKDNEKKDAVEREKQQIAREERAREREEKAKEEEHRRELERK